MNRCLFFALVLLLVAGAAFAQEPAPSPLAILVQTLGKTGSVETQAVILRGMSVSLKGRTGLAAPGGWNELYDKLKASPNAEVRDLAKSLGAIFGSSAVLAEMRQALADAAAPEAARLTALETLAAARDVEALAPLLALVPEPGALRAPALRVLSGYEDPRIAPAILGTFRTLDSSEKRDALNTLLGRASNARAFVAAIDAGTMNRAEITAPLARQMQNLKAPEIDAWLTKTWGSVKTTSADKQAQIAKYKEFLAPNLIAAADVNRGRAIFAQTCAACHSLHGVGGKVGPELPGSFEDVDYLLQNILDPNAIIGKDYQQTFVTLRDGQIVSGIVAGEDATSVTLKTLGDAVTVQRDKIAEMKVSEQSMMPEGLLTALDEQSVRDLFLYLRQKQQVSLLATPMNANDFFSGNDLARWKPSTATAWKVEGGELVGRSTGPRPVSLLSEMLADSFRFTARIKVTGDHAAAEVIVRGRHGSKGFNGTALSLGGKTPANLWTYATRDVKPESREVIPLDARQWVAVEIVTHGEKTELRLDGKSVTTIDAPTNLRTAFAFYVARGELRIREPKLEVFER
jgi:putative heme-binding domain-containing protein